MDFDGYNLREQSYGDAVEVVEKALGVTVDRSRVAYGTQGATAGFPTSLLVAQHQQFGVLAQVSPHQHDGQTEQTARELVQDRKQQHPTMIHGQAAQEKRRSARCIEFPSPTGSAIMVRISGGFRLDVMIVEALRWRSTISRSRR